MPSPLLHDAPHDRTIEVHVRTADIWLRVKWDPIGVTAVDGFATLTGRWESRERTRSSFWLGPGDIDAWRLPADLAPRPFAGAATS